MACLPPRCDTRVPAYARQALVVSPGAEAKILGVLRQPGTVTIEAEELGYCPAVMRALEAKGRLVRMILPANIGASDRRHVETLGHYGVQVRLLPVKPHYLHTKAFCATNECFIGPVNLSDVSFNDNRELGLLLDGRDVGILERQFDHDRAIAD